MKRPNDSCRAQMVSRTPCACERELGICIVLAPNRVPEGDRNKHIAIDCREGVIVSSNYAIAPLRISRAQSCIVDRLRHCSLLFHTRYEIHKRDRLALCAVSARWCGQASDPCSIQ